MGNIQILGNVCPFSVIELTYPDKICNAIWNDGDGDVAMVMMVAMMVMLAMVMTLAMVMMVAMFDT